MLEICAVTIEALAAPAPIPIRATPVAKVLAPQEVWRFTPDAAATLARRSRLLATFGGFGSGRSTQTGRTATPLHRHLPLHHNSGGGFCWRCTRIVALLLDESRVGLLTLLRVATLLVGARRYTPIRARCTLIRSRRDTLIVGDPHQV